MTATTDDVMQELAAIVTEMRCQLEAIDAVAVATAAVFFNVLPGGSDLIGPMRTSSARLSFRRDQIITRSTASRYFG